MQNFYFDNFHTRICSPCLSPFFLVLPNTDLQFRNSIIYLDLDLLLHFGPWFFTVPLAGDPC